MEVINTFIVFFVVDLNAKGMDIYMFKMLVQDFTFYIHKDSQAFIVSGKGS